MNLRFFLVLIFELCLQVSMAKALVPEVIREHIDREFTPHIQVLNNLGYSDDQNDRVIDRYTDGLIKQYKAGPRANFRQEVNTLIKDRLSNSGTVEKSGYTFSKSANMKPTDINQLKEYVENFKDKNYRIGIINVPFQGILIPLFVSKYFGGKLQISLDGLTIDSAMQTSSLLRPEGISGALACLILVFDTSNTDADLSILNADHMACPIPLKASGRYLLELAEELARGLGKKTISGSDQSIIRCKKNNKSASLPRWNVYQLGKTWYGFHGYRYGDHDDAITSSHRSFLLATMKADLDGLTKEPEIRKKAMLASATYSFQKEVIENDFSKFEDLKQIFDAEFAAFMIANPSKNTLGQFFNWLWDKDCAHYTDLEELIFKSQATKDLGIRQLPWLSTSPSKKL